MATQVLGPYASDVYIDFYICIMACNGSDWKFSVSLDIQLGTTYDGDPQYAENDHEPFDEAEDEPPAEVTKAFLAARPGVVAQLEAMKAKATP